MKLKVEIRRNSDGFVTTDVWENWQYNTFWWEEGNASCDCNRERFFNSALGLEDADEETECSDDRYSVRLSDATTEKILYDEF